MQILIRAPEELKVILLGEAKKQGTTLNGLIRQILWDWVRKNEKAGTLTRERTEYR